MDLKSDFPFWTVQNGPLNTYRPLTGSPILGAHPAFPHAYFALGFGGDGITFAEIASRTVTDLFLGRKNRDEAVFRFGR